MRCQGAHAVARWCRARSGPVHRVWRLRCEVPGRRHWPAHVFPAGVCAIPGRPACGPYSLQRQRRWRRGYRQRGRHCVPQRSRCPIAGRRQRGGHRFLPTPRPRPMRPMSEGQRRRSGGLDPDHVADLVRARRAVGPGGGREPQRSTGATLARGSPVAVAARLSLRRRFAGIGGCHDPAAVGRGCTCVRVGFIASEPGTPARGELPGGAARTRCRSAVATTAVAQAQHQRGLHGLHGLRATLPDRRADSAGRARRPPHRLRAGSLHRLPALRADLPAASDRCATHRAGRRCRQRQGHAAFARAAALRFLSSALRCRCRGLGAVLGMQQRARTERRMARAARRRPKLS